MVEPHVKFITMSVYCVESSGLAWGAWYLTFGHSFSLTSTVTGNVALWFEQFVRLMTQQTEITTKWIVFAQYASLRVHNIGEKIGGTQSTALDLSDLSLLRGTKTKQEVKQSDLGCKGQQDASRLKVMPFSFFYWNGRPTLNLCKYNMENNFLQTTSLCQIFPGFLWPKL